MKKIFSTLVALTLILCTLFAFTGCKSDQDKLVGTWTAKANFGEISGVEQLNGVVLEITLEFNDDDTAKMYVSEEAQEDFIAAFKALGLPADDFDFSDFENEGDYKAEDGKLTLGDGDPIDYTLEEDTLTFTSDDATNPLASLEFKRK